VQTLETLPEREYISGLAEVVKYGVVADSDFLILFMTTEQSCWQGIKIVC
jgi:3-dehydroquinate synthetase